MKKAFTLALVVFVGAVTLLQAAMIASFNLRSYLIQRKFL